MSGQPSGAGMSFLPGTHINGSMRLRFDVGEDSEVGGTLWRSLT